MEIWIAKQSARFGPYTVDQVRAFIHEGRILFSDLAWHSNIPSWIPVSSIPELQPIATGIGIPPIIQPPPVPHPIDQSFTQTLAESAGRGWISRHLFNYTKRAPWPFCWRISLEGIAASMLAGIIVALFINEPVRADFLRNPVTFIFSAIFIAPLLETLLFQSLIVGMMHRAKPWTKVIASMIFFALAHFPVGIGTGIAAGIVGGFYFGFTYVFWRQKSFAHAYWITAGTHFLHNALLLLPCMFGL